MKKTISLILAVTLITSFAAGIFLGDIVSASEAPLPKISGTTIVDTDPSDDITGDYVIVQNVGESVGNTGALNGIQSVASVYQNNSIYTDQNGKLDFAMPFIPEPATASNIRAAKRSARLTINDTKTFIVRDIYSYQPSQKSFTLQSQGTHCNVWVPTNEESWNSTRLVIPADKTKQIAEEFDKAYQAMVDAFGSPSYPSGSNEVNLMLYDIQDGNNPSAYIAGFYSPNDFRDNQLAMLHIDTYPAIYRPNGAIRVENCYSTLVHEFQHLINDSRYIQANGAAARMDTWLNEALSMAAEEMVYEGSAVPMRLNSYLSDYSKSIRRGKSLTAFDNSLESYALSCLFSAYLKEQTGSTQVFKKIINEYYSSGDIEAAISSALSGSPLAGLGFDNVLAAYKLALTVNDEKGVYGFKNNPALSSLRPLIYSGNPINLPPDGIIAVKTTSGRFKPSGNGDSIQFIGAGEFTGAPIISNTPTDLVVGEEHTLIGTGEGSLKWSSDNLNVATVTDSGLVAAVGEGTVIISLENALATDSVSIDVKAPYVKINNPQQKLMEGLTVSLTADIRPAAKVIWSTSDSGIATVSDNGLVTAVSKGIVQITAKDEKSNLSDTVSLEIIEKTELAGLTVDYNSKQMDIIDASGMTSLSDIINNPSNHQPVLGDGLKDWTINLAAPITLVNHIPIGTAANPFKGAFNGNRHGITVESIVPTSDLKNIGVFGFCHMDGVINNINVIVTGTIGVTGDQGIGAKYVGAVCGYNQGRIVNPSVSITSTGKILAHTHAGGIVGDNKNYLENSNVKNDGIISAYGSPAGGVAGHTMGELHKTAVINGATVLNNGTISSNDDVAGVVGHHQTWFNRNGYFRSQMIGRINVTIGPNGKILCTKNTSTASVGGVIGLNDGEPPIGNAPGSSITIRIDGNISTPRGDSGGIIGEGLMYEKPADDFYAAVTLGPNSSIINGSSANNGLFFSNTNNQLHHEHFVYAVPYGSDYYAFPTNAQAAQDQKVKRIEYPNEHNPSEHIDVSVPVNIVYSPSNSPAGIFKKLSPAFTGKSLEIKSAVDSEIFTIDAAAQKISSSYKIAPNYYDFVMEADGIPITVPAYLTIKAGDPPPAMTLEISSAKLCDNAEDAKLNPADGSQEIVISAANGRITDWTITRNDSDYKSAISNAELTSDTLKKFSVSDRGVYKITATGTPLDGTAQQTKEAYLCIGGIPRITLSGELLTSSQSESLWTNLATKAQVQTQTSTKSKQAVFTLATAKALYTTIEDIVVTKDAAPFKLDSRLDYLVPPTNADAERTFKLYETGRYKISASGVNCLEPAVGYINIDVDNPLPPILNKTGLNANSTSIGFSLVQESTNQSPTFAEYSVDGGSFVKAINGIIPINIGKTRIRTQDLAGNLSDEILIERKEIIISLSADPPAGGQVSGGGSFSVVILEESGTAAPLIFNAAATIRATAKAGYSFVNWTSNNNQVFTSAETSLITDHNMHLTAHFEALPVPPDPPVSSDPASSTPEPPVSSDPASSTPEPPVSSDPASSTPEPPVSSDPASSTPEPPVSSDPASSTPEPPVSSDPASSTPEPPVSSDPAYNDYEPPRGDYIKLSYSAGAGGTIKSNAEQWIKRYSDGAIVSAIPDEGYRFVKWSDGSTDPNRHDTSVFGDISVTAWFERIADTSPAVITPVEVPKTGAKNPKPYILVIASMALGIFGYSLFRFRKTAFKK